MSVTKLTNWLQLIVSDAKLFKSFYTIPWKRPKFQNQQSRNRFQTCLVLLQATVQVRNGEILLNGDVVDDDIVPLKFKPVLDDAEAVVELEKEMMEPKTDTAGKNLNILLKHDEHFSWVQILVKLLAYSFLWESGDLNMWRNKS